MWLRKLKLRQKYGFLIIKKTCHCPINHEVSAGSLEAAGVVDCFMNSIENRKLRYTHYIGDGDSKAYNEVVKNGPYPGIVVEKLECVGHIQKRLGSRLRNLKHAMKGPLADGKTLGGKGHLTDKVINKLQNNFGITIRQSTGNTVYQLKKNNWSCVISLLRSSRFRDLSSDVPTNSR